MEKLFLKNRVFRKIKELYKILQDVGEVEKPAYCIKWESELGVVPSGVTWEAIFNATHKSAIDTRMIETNFKCLARWYMTPDRLNKLQPELSRNCWRGCTTRGTMAHLWWVCPIIKKFWQEVLKIIQEITGVEIKEDPWVVMFHGMEGHRSKYIVSLTPILLNSAKSLIPKKWQEAEGPSIRDWLIRVNETYILEAGEVEESELGTETDLDRDKWAKWITFKETGRFAEKFL